MREQTHVFSCEQCSDPVTMTWAEYEEQQVHHKGKGKPRWWRGTKGGKYGLKILCADCEKKAEARKRGSLVDPATKKRPSRRDSEFPPKAQLNLKPSERDDFGVTATLREQGSDEVLTVASSGPVLQALTTICEMADAREGEWRIVSISTPATIFADLQGWRNDGSPSSEATLLGKIHRRDLLEARR